MSIFSPNSRSAIALGLLLPICLFVAGCSSVQEFVSKSGVMPTASVDGVKLDSVSFDSVDMLFDVGIQNPNPAGISLAGMDWQLDFDGSRFLGGATREKLSIEPKGRSQLAVPASIEFAELFAAVSSLRNASELPYQFKGSLGFDVPLLGHVDVPVSHSGALPALRVPSVSVASLDLRNISFSGAELAIALDVDNPNTFGMVMQALDFDLGLNGNSVFKGNANEDVSFASGGSGRINLPVSLDFANAGRALFSALSGDRVDCQVQGNMDVGTSLPDIAGLSFPFDTRGKIPILK